MLRATRQAYGEHRTLARVARHRHVAAHHARELAGDGKAEPRAAEALRGRGIGLAELLEQLRLLLRRHADAGVGHGEFDPVVTVGDPPRPQLDLALNLQALLSRLSRICLSRMESAVSGATFSFASTKEMREEPEQPVKLPHLHNLGSPAYLELSGTMVGRAGLHLWRGSGF